MIWLILSICAILIFLVGFFCGYFYGILEGARMCGAALEKARREKV